MNIFIIVIFGLATLRTIAPFGEEKTYTTDNQFLAQIIVTGTTCVAYYYLLKLLIK